MNILEKQWDAWREQSWNKRAEIKLGGSAMTVKVGKFTFDFYRSDSWFPMTPWDWHLKTLWIDLVFLVIRREICPSDSPW